MNYYMTGPEGERYYGWWEITVVDEPNSFSFKDGFADENFKPDENMPVSDNVFTFIETDGLTHATYVSTYETAEALQKVLEMGVVEGASAAINQIDVLVNA